MGIEEVTMAITRLALDAGQMRQTAIAANIANINNPGYVPLTVSFEEQLVAARRNLEMGGGVRAASLSGVRAELASLEAEPDGKGVELDAELAKLVTNSVQFQTLLKGVAKHYAMLQLAVTEGKK